MFYDVSISVIPIKNVNMAEPTTDRFFYIWQIIEPDWLTSTD